MQEVRPLRARPEPLRLEGHAEHVRRADGRDEDRDKERRVLADLLEEVAGFEVEAARALGLANGRAGGRYRRDEPQGRRDGEGEAVGDAELDEARRYLLVAGGREEDHAGYDRRVYLERHPDPVQQRLPLDEQEHRRLALAEHGPHHYRNEPDHDEDKAYALQVYERPRQRPERDHQREHHEPVEGVNKQES